MNRFPYWSNDRLGSQQASPSGSPAPRAISLVVHVLPPSKLTPSNIPAASPASPWPTLVTVTMLSGLAGLTAIASSDSFRCRWLISMLAGVAVAARGVVRAAPSAAGAAASAAPVTIAATTIRNRKRYMAVLPPQIRNADGSAGITSGVEMAGHTMRWAVQPRSLPHASLEPVSAAAIAAVEFGGRPAAAGIAALSLPAASRRYPTRPATPTPSR